MKAAAIREFGGRDKLEILELPEPCAGAGEVRIAVKAAGVNPVDWKIREGYLKDLFPHEFPLILGWDAAGVVDQVGPGTSGVSIGDAVYAYCRKPVVKDGTQAEFVVAPADFVGPKPRSFSFEEAAAVPLAALTAYQALFDAGSLQAGQVVLVHAAAGGVGSFAVQLAAARGAHVVGTASSRNHEYARELGAAEIIDYTATDFVEAVRRTHPDGADLVFDCVGGDTLPRSAAVLKEAGRIVSIVDPARIETMKQEGIDARFVFVAPNSAQLRRLAAMADEGRLKVHVDRVLPLDEVAVAHEAMESHHTRGKIVLTI